MGVKPISYINMKSPLTNRVTGTPIAIHPVYIMFLSHVQGSTKSHRKTVNRYITGVNSLHNFVTSRSDVIR